MTFVDVISFSQISYIKLYFDLNTTNSFTVVSAFLGYVAEHFLHCE